MATKKAKAPAKAVPAEDAPTPVEVTAQTEFVPAEDAPPPPPPAPVAPVESLEARVADLEERLRNVDGIKPLYKR